MIFPIYQLLSSLLGMGFSQGFPHVFTKPGAGRGQGCSAAIRRICRARGARVRAIRAIAAQGLEINNFPMKDGDFCRLKVVYS